MRRDEYPLIAVDRNDPVRVAGKEIANRLGEKYPHARWAIYLLAREYGLPWVEELANLAIAIHAQGGMKTLDGTAQRTLGGIFFRLAKDKLTLPVYTDLIPPEGIWKRQATIVRMQRRRAYYAARRAAQAAAAASSPSAA